jgi:hypothetical protein
MASMAASAVVRSNPDNRRASVSACSIFFCAAAISSSVASMTL